MDDSEYRDFCAATALAGLIARNPDDDDDLRHRYHILSLEAFRVADEMVEMRRNRNTKLSR